MQIIQVKIASGGMAHPMFQFEYEVNAANMVTSMVGRGATDELAEMRESLKAQLGDIDHVQDWGWVAEIHFLIARIDMAIDEWEDHRSRRSKNAVSV